MDRRLFLTALAGGFAATATFGLSAAQASPAQPATSAELTGVRAALSPAAPADGDVIEMQRRRMRRGPRRRWGRRWVRPRRRRCWINRRGLRVCRWY